MVIRAVRTPKPWEVALKRRLGTVLRKHRGGGSEQCRSAGADHQCDRFAGLGDRPPEQRIDGFAGIELCDNAGALLNWIRFTGERGLAGGEGCALKNERIGWDDVAGTHTNEVTWHHIFDGNLLEGAIAPDFRLQRDRAAQHFGRPQRVPFLQGIEADGDAQNGDDDSPTDAVAGRNRDDPRDDQDQGERLKQALAKSLHKACPPRRSVAIRADAP
jgi:hypothetical protein